MTLVPVRLSLSRGEWPLERGAPTRASFTSDHCVSPLCLSFLPDKTVTMPPRGCRGSGTLSPGTAQGHPAHGERSADADRGQHWPWGTVSAALFS